MFCSCCFLFFNQKTAYDMRSSDWSSDVCSSDLLDRHPHRLQPHQLRRFGDAGHAPARKDVAQPRRALREARLVDTRHALDHRGQREFGPFVADQRRSHDRKNGVSGKSVSASVALGGSSIIKKTKTKTKKHKGSQTSTT